jgi:uncharacterized membrane protein
MRHNGHNGHTMTPRKRVDWKDQTDLEAMVLAACGWGTSVIVDETGLSPGQVHYRMKKAEIRITDFRRIIPNTVGGRIARQQLRRDMNDYQGVVRNTLKHDLPTKRESRNGHLLMGERRNGRSRV